MILLLNGMIFKGDQNIKVFFNAEAPRGGAETRRVNNY